jgi:hypothetical protein
MVVGVGSVWVGWWLCPSFELQTAKNPFLWEAEFFPNYFTNFLVGQLRTAGQRVPVSYDRPRAPVSRSALRAPN